MENKLKIKRNKKSITILILIILCFVFAVDQVNMAYYLQNFKSSVLVYNGTLNKTMVVSILLPVCYQANSDVTLAQDLVFVIMRFILPFIVMVICNVILIRHIRQSRNRVIRGSKERKEHSFTKTVAIMNGSFLVFNIGIVVYYIMTYYMKFSGIKFGQVQTYIFSTYGTCALLFSNIFFLSQFFSDMIFNKVFRKEILEVIMILSGRRNQIDQTRGGNTNTNNSAAN